MSAKVRKLPLVLGLVALVATPLVTRLLVHGDMPDTWGEFPPPKSPDVPGFSWLVFGLGVALALGILEFLRAPQRFGFAPPAAAREEYVPRVRFPPWCVPGALLAMASWALMWGELPDAAAPLVPFSFVPLWWGFILALDGVVYRRTGGLSLVARRPWAMLAIAATSCVSWYFFEYLNYFTRSQNPNFWKYDVPYVNVLHVYEMPLLGYFGYLPFGMLCWVWWIHHARLLGIDPAIDVVAGAGPTLTRPSDA